MSMAQPVSGGRTSRSVVDIDVFTEDVEAMLHRLNKAVGEYSLMFWLEHDATDFFHDDIESRFEEEGDAKSGFWEPLHDATVDIRRADGFPDGPTNVRTGELKDFLLQDYDVFGGPNFAEMNVPGSPGASDVATKLATAQHGSNNNPLGYGPTVARPVLATSEMDLFRLVQSLEGHIVSFMLGAPV
jgi:hypothetical protein